jgi:hypothetical protein
MTTTTMATTMPNDGNTLEAGLMKAEGEMARPTLFLTLLSRRTKYIVGACLVAFLVLLIGTTSLVRSSIIRRHQRSVSCGETFHTVSVSHNYGENYGDSYSVRSLSCTRGSDVTILMVDDLWGMDIGHSGGSTTRSGPDGNGLVGYGLYTYPDGNVAYHYTYTIGDGYGGGNDGTIHVAFSNGITYDIAQDTILLITSQSNENEGDAVQVQQVNVDLSSALRSGNNLQTLVDDNYDVSSFIAQSMANYVEKKQQEQEEDNGNN